MTHGRWRDNAARKKSEHSHDTSTEAGAPAALSRRRRIGAAFAVVTAMAVVVTLVVVPGLFNGGTGPSFGPTPSRDSRGETSDPTVVDGAEPDDARPIGGAVGQEIAANFPLDPDTDKVASSLWWRWTADDSATVRFSTVGSELDTAIRVRESGPEGPVVAEGSAAGDLAAGETSFDADEGQTYYIEVTSEEPALTEGLVVLSWQTQAAVVQEPPTDPHFTAPEIPLVGTTGEKPQSKVWDAAGSTWAVLASATTSPAGTWVWRQTGNSWAAVTRVSDRTDVRADVLPAGDVVHVLLHGPQTSLVSLTHDPSSGTYVPWSGRPEPTVVSLPGSETATIDLDGTGRMWLATEAASQIQMRWADAPYASFSAPITVANGITEDDISVVTAMPGGIGVLWSNQSTRRFGFRTHADGAAPGTWSSTQQPGGAGMNQGGGIADDHVNVAVASDGTLYAAVKTSYDASGAPVIGLLVRRPNGSWDPLRTVDTRGTRPVVLIDEATATLRVLYTASERLDNILQKTTSLAALDFGGAPETVLEGAYNNVTSVKRNSPGQVLVLAGGASRTGTRVLQWQAPGAPVASDSSLATSLGVRVEGSVSVAGGPVEEIDVVEAPAHGILDLTGGDGFGYTPVEGFTGTDTFVFRARVGTQWSGTAQVRIGVAEDQALLGSWDFEEGAGTTVTDTSVWGHTGTVSGGATWVPGVQGTGAMRFDGLSGKVTIPDAPAFDDATGQLTVAAWVRPERIATQYVVKKADSDLVDGFELSFNSSGYPYLRLNHASADNAYRLMAPSVPVADGTRWTHLVGTYDGGVMRLYMDGVEVASQAGPAAIGDNALPVLLGAQPSASNPLRGAVDGVRLYSRALSATEVGALMTGSDPAPSPTPTPTPTPDVPEGSPVGVWALDEASGPAVTDASGWGNHGTISGGVARIPGVTDGGALAFDGQSGRATIPHSASLDASTALTIATWVRADRVATQHMVKKSTNGGVDGYELSLASSGRPFFRLNQATSGDAFRVNAPATIPANGSTWVHLTGTYDGTLMRLYIDGAQAASLAGPASIGSNGLALSLGAQPGGGYPFEGALDDVRIYNRALTTAEVAALVAGHPTPAPSATPTPSPTASPTPTPSPTATPTPTPSPTASPTPSPTASPTPSPTAPPVPADPAAVLVWNLDEQSGTAARDASGLGNDGVLSGGIQRITGVSGGGVRTDGASGAVTVPDHTSLDIAGALTLSVWVRPEQVGTQTLVKKATNHAASGYELAIASNGRPFFRLNQQASGDTHRVTAPSPIVADGTRWTHVAGTHDGTTMRLYIDGQQVGSVAGPSSVMTNNLPLVIGLQPGGGHALRGGLDSVHVYTRALSGAEVAALAALA